MTDDCTRSHLTVGWDTNNRFQRISDVVYEEIAKISKNRPSLLSYNCLDRGIHKEISNKVEILRSSPTTTTTPAAILNDSEIRNQNDIGKLQITLWIANILQDSSFKLLEEDLRGKKNQERKLGKEEKLVTLIEKHHLNTYRRSSQELEEEEGPALDFLDSLVNKVLKICTAPSNIKSDTDDSFSSSLLQGLNEDHVSEKSKDYNENLELDGTNSTIDMSHIDVEQKTDLNNQFQGHIGQETESEVISDYDGLDFPYETSGENDYNDSSGPINTVSSISDMKRHPLIDGTDNIPEIGKYVEDNIPEIGKNVEDNMPEIGKDVEDNIPEIVKDVETVEDTEIGKYAEADNVADLDNNESNAIPNTIELERKEDLDDLMATVINEDNINVSEVFVELSGELLNIDDRNKKVKFSITNMVTRGEPREYGIRNSIVNSILNRIDHKMMISYTMSFDNKPDITIAPPNDHLLSDADELWPENISTPMLKVSESVSKSISSLGNIIETEERVSNSQDEDYIKQKAISSEENIKITEPDSSKDGEPYHQITGTQILVKNAEDGFESSDNSSTESPQIIQEVKVQIYKIKETEKAPTEDIDSKKNKDKKESIRELLKERIRKRLQDWSTEQSKLISSDEKIQDVGKGDHFILEGVQPIIEPRYMKSKIDYKVDPNTAPAWAIRKQPSEDSLLNFTKINTKQKLKESEVRKWCKDLEQSFINLEQWNNWVENTCRKIIFYKQKEKNNVCAPNTRKTEARYWIKFKKTVNRDAFLWSKLSQRTQEILTKYKCCHKNVKHSVIKNENETLSYGDYPYEEYILKTLDEFDRHCFWIHRLIVSTEHCMKCNCYNNYSATMANQTNFNCK